MTKPRIVKWINGLILFRLAVLLLTIAVTAFVLYTQPDRGFLTGFADAAIERLSVDRYAGTSYIMGYMIGNFGIIIAIVFLEFVFLKTQKRIGFWITISFDILITFAAFGFPLLPIITLILALNKTNRHYLAGDISTV